MHPLSVSQVSNLETSRRRVERPAFPSCFAAGHDPYAGDDRLLVHIKAGYPIMYHIHRFPLFNRRCRRGDLSRMNPKKRARGAGRPLAQVGVFEVPRVQLGYGLFHTKG